ncbi:Sulfotransferase family protein [Filimonas lacunae]|uniref:Sulfotransferase family protein n=1 Tax=Filimonas lacunae TaxID=477680 RepID=A0A173M9R4_9BACT|nr:sulfotransferase [Filimonas lacunae]BAV04251.1 hypothetical protein FLA_0230 [Filimonas lacunae]SIT13556.1 Sulfotransferase family protein [Filimonas lacunae]
MNNKVLVIAGMHRSGTSLITQWLQRCGLQIGDRLLGVGFDNVEGHFEDCDFVELHEKLLAENNLDSTGLVLDKKPAFSEKQKAEIAQLVHHKNQLYPAWAWKDPRTCLFLPEYKDIIPDAFYLVIVRDYKAVVSSLLSRMHKDAEMRYRQKGLFKRLLWNTIEKNSRKKLLLRKYGWKSLMACTVYNEQLLEHIQTLPGGKYILVDYAQLSRQDNEVFSTLQRQWQFPLRYIPFTDVYKENLISRQWDFLPHIKDKALIERAQASEENLRNAIKNANAF